MTVVASAIGAAMSAAWNFEDPIAAAKDAFTKGMAGLKQTAETQNPFAAFKDTFDKTVRDASQGLEEQGGMKKAITRSRDSVQSQVKAAMDQAKSYIPDAETPEYKKRKPGDYGQGGDGKKESQGRQRREGREAGGLRGQ